MGKKRKKKKKEKEKKEREKGVSGLFVFENPILYPFSDFRNKVFVFMKIDSFSIFSNYGIKSNFRLQI